MSEPGLSLSHGGRQRQNGGDNYHGNGAHGEPDRLRVRELSIECPDLPRTVNGTVVTLETSQSPISPYLSVMKRLILKSLFK